MGETEVDWFRYGSSTESGVKCEVASSATSGCSPNVTPAKLLTHTSISSSTALPIACFPSHLIQWVSIWKVLRVSTS